jgi:hypothetical protein
VKRVTQQVDAMTEQLRRDNAEIAAFWEAVAADPTLIGGFAATSLANMRKGNAPFAPRAYQENQSGAGLRF